MKKLCINVISLSQCTDGEDFKNFGADQLGPKHNPHDPLAGFHVKAAKRGGLFQ